MTAVVYTKTEVDLQLAPLVKALVATNSSLAALEARVAALEAPPQPPPAALWHDSIQSATSVAQCGFDHTKIEHPINPPTTIPGSDAGGANLSVVPDPMDATRKALRRFIRFSGGGGRAQNGWIGANNVAFNTQAKEPEGIYVAWDMLIPQALSATGAPWLDICGFHSLDAGQSNRWATNPGLHLRNSMQFLFEWGAQRNPNSSWATKPLPVGRWFQMEVFRQHSSARNAAVRCWLDSELVIEQTGVQTAAPSHANVEGYMNWYGANEGGVWTPDAVESLICNVRWDNGRLT